MSAIVADCVALGGGHLGGREHDPFALIAGDLGSWRAWRPQAGSAAEDVARCADSCGEGGSSGPGSSVRQRCSRAAAVALDPIGEAVGQLRRARARRVRSSGASSQRSAPSTSWTGTSGVSASGGAWASDRSMMRASSSIMRSCASSAPRPPAIVELHKKLAPSGCSSASSTNLRIPACTACSAGAASTVCANPLDEQRSPVRDGRR